MAAVAELVRDTLGETVLGVYRFGSPGGLKPRSDLDFLLVVDAPIAAPDALRDGLAGLDAGRLAPAGPNPDLAILLTMVLDADAPLLGPPPAELLDPVPFEDLVRAMRAGLLDLDVEHDTTNALLTLARIWCTLETRSIRSKDAAADWALERGHDAALAHARDVYRGAEERWEAYDAGAAAAAIRARCA